jgi:hypothetical protein
VEYDYQNTAKFEKKKDQRKSAPVAAAVQPTKDEIKREIELLKAAVQKAYAARGRFWFHAALEGSYSLYVAWKDLGKSKKAAKVAAALFGVKIKDGAHPLSVIIKIVTPTGVDTRRWLDGLRFARKQGVAPKDLVPFLKANGGIAGCARQFHAQG